MIHAIGSRKRPLARLHSLHTDDTFQVADNTSRTQSLTSDNPFEDHDGYMPEMPTLRPHWRKAGFRRQMVPGQASRDFRPDRQILTLTYMPSASNMPRNSGITS